MACLYPFFVKNPNYPRFSEKAEVPVPCGKCPTCLQRRAAEWCFRLREESKIHLSSSFITLTYETPRITPNGFMSLHTPDYQRFMKRLRYLHPKVECTETGKMVDRTIRYYAVGEYGTERMRPHYHAIIFGHDPDLIAPAWQADCFPQAGIVDVQPVSEATIAYVCKYLHKGKSVPQHEHDDRIPEMSMMSKGLGACYLTDEIIQYHRDDLSRTYVIQDGFKKAMPRYYRVRLYDDSDRLDQCENVQDKSIKAELSRRRDYIARTGSIDGYEDYVYYSKKAQVINFKKRANAKRKDL